MTRTLALAAVTASLIGCKGDAPHCPPLADLRAELAALPDFVAPTVPTVDTVDGTPDHRAVRVTFRYQDKPGDAAPWVSVAGAAPLSWSDADAADTTVARVNAALAGGGPAVVEIEAPSALPLRALLRLTGALPPAVEVHLVVVRMAEPPVAGAARWAVDEVAHAATGASGGMHALALAMKRAAGARCYAQIDRRISAAHRPDGSWDAAAMHTALPDGLDACGCAGTDLATMAFLYRAVVYPSLQPSYLRAKIVPHGAPLPDLHDVRDFANALAALPPDARAFGVSPELR